MIRELDAAGLVDRARTIADQAGRGIRRNGALCAAVALAEMSTIAKVRQLLDESGIPEEVRLAAHGVLAQVVTEATESKGAP